MGRPPHLREEGLVEATARRERPTGLATKPPPHPHSVPTCVSVQTLPPGTLPGADLPRPYPGDSEPNTHWPQTSHNLLPPEDQGEGWVHLSGKQFTTGGLEVVQDLMPTKQHKM